MLCEGWWPKRPQGSRSGIEHQVYVVCALLLAKKSAQSRVWPSIRLLVTMVRTSSPSFTCARALSSGRSHVPATNDRGLPAPDVFT